MLLGCSLGDSVYLKENTKWVQSLLVESQFKGSYSALNGNSEVRSFSSGWRTRFIMAWKTLGDHRNEQGPKLLFFLASSIPIFFPGLLNCLQFLEVSHILYFVTTRSPSPLLFCAAISLLLLGNSTDTFFLGPGPEDEESALFSPWACFPGMA